MTDQRSANRWREHTADGHVLAESTIEGASTHRPGERLYRCSCGWFGWLVPLDHDPKPATNGN